MTIQTNKNDPNNRGHNRENELTERLRLLWLGIRFRNIYFSDDANINVEEIRQLLDEEDDDVEVSS
jgi:hypothetical protein